MLASTETHMPDAFGDVPELQDAPSSPQGLAHTTALEPSLPGQKGQKLRAARSSGIE